MIRPTGRSPIEAFVLRQVAMGTVLLAAVPFIAFGLFAGSCHVRSMRTQGDRASEIARLRGKVLSISPEVVDPANRGRLVHLTGLAQGEAVIDEDLRIGAPGLVLERHVSMYQWREDCRLPQGQRRRRYNQPCQYTKVWHDAVELIQDKRAGDHVNPPFPFAAGTTRFVAGHPTIGVHRIANFALPEPPADALYAFPLAPGHFDVLPGYVQKRARIEGGGVYVGSAGASQIGDVRIRYRLVKDMRVSLVGEQNAFGLLPHSLPDGSTFVAIKEGVHSADDLIGAAGRPPRDHWMNHVIIGTFVAAGMFLLFWPLREWGRIVPGPALVTGAGVYLFVPLATAAVYSCALAHGWWAIERDAAVAAVMAAGVSAGLLLIASAVRELLPPR